MKLITLILTVLLLSVNAVAQTGSELTKELEELQIARERVLAAVDELDYKIERVKLKMLHQDILSMGFPTNDEVVHHQAMSLSYSEEHEQARWVMHIISPDIIEGGVHRTNDFRIDTLVKTGTAVEADYFLKTPNGKGDYHYDGFGYDRGHLAPSADFRWSRTALSESYYYSNMAPQLPGFNREKWAELENQLRGYVVRNPESQLYVVTGPVFEGEVKVIERSNNKVAIPSKFFKVALDLKNNRAIGFILPHQENLQYPIESYITSVDKVEELTGFNFFPSLEDETCESSYNAESWLPALEKGDVVPMSAPDLPRKHFNTVDAKIYMDDGSKVNVVGTVVSARKSRKGNVLINLDKQFPNQIFTIFIRKEHIVNFSYDPVTQWKGKTIVVNGKVSKLGGTPTMYVDGEKQISAFEP